MATQAHPGAISNAIAPTPIDQFRDEVIERYRSRPGPDYFRVRKVFQIAGELGARTTADLTPEFIDKFASATYGRDGAERSKLDQMRLFKSLCDAAVAMGYLTASPFADRPDQLGRQRLSIPKRERPPFTPAQFDAVMKDLERLGEKSVVRYRFYAVVAVFAYAGLSQPDVARLKVSDLDFGAGAIRVPHRDRRFRRPDLIPMPAALAAILKEWLRRRRGPLGPKSKLNESDIAEAKRLRSEGWTRRKLWEHYGVSESTIDNALAGRTWRHVPAEGDVARRVADSEWLFPKLADGSGGPCTGPHLLGHKSALMPLKAAGRSAGVEGLRITDIRCMHKCYITHGLAVPGTIGATPLAIASPSGADRVSTNEPLTLGDSYRVPPIIDGNPMSVCFAPAEFDVLKVIPRQPPGISTAELNYRSKHKYARTAVRDSIKRFPILDKMIRRPGRKNSGDGFWIGPP